MIIRTTDHTIGTEVTTSTATPVYADSLQIAQGYMVRQVGAMLLGSAHQVATLEERCIRLEKQDGTGGTTWLITED